MTDLMKGKAGLVTASGSGIGRASAMAMAANGAKVMITDISAEAGNETVKMIRDKGGEAEFFKCDVTDENQVKALVDHTVSTFGKLDFAHNNAGLSFSQAKMGDTGSMDWDKTIKLTMYSVFYCMKHEINVMLESGSGAIVNTASTAGIEGVPNMTPYAAAKHGVVGMTKTAALEYGKEKIRVNSIAPGSTLTPSIESWAEQAPEQYETVLASIPSGEMAAPEDQGNAVMFLCSDLAKQISGVVLPVDSGFAAGKLG